MSGPITYGDKSGQQSDLVSQPLAVRRTFGLVTINVAAGYECQVYRNNQPYKTLNAGRHRWWDWGFFFVSYTAQMVDIREQTMTQPIVGSGELVDAEGQRIPVTVRFQLTYRLTSINIWFNTVDPMKKLRLLVTNKVASEVSVLPYDPQRPWYIVLRNELEVYLQTVAAAQTGLTVLNVLIAQEPAEDARITKVYRDRFLAAEALKQRRAHAVNDGDILRDQAQAVKDAAAIVGANAGDVFVAQQPGGEGLIDAGVKLRAIEAASGQQLGSTTVTAQPQQPAQLPPGSYTGPNTNTNPGAYSGGYTGPNASSPFGTYGYGASAGLSQSRRSPPFPVQSRASTQPQTKGAKFTVVAPSESPIETWNPLLVYIHTATALSAVREDMRRFSHEWGPVITGSSEPIQTLTQGMELTIVPECEGVTFDPEYDTVKWVKDMQRRDFKFKGEKGLAGLAKDCRITIYVGPVIVATALISLSFGNVIEPLRDKQEHPMVESSAYFYRRIFVSYSYDDISVVLACKNAYHAIGDIVLIDREVVQTGRLLDDALKSFIEEADIFQLFWSARSAASQPVRIEWEHALLLHKGEGFIRPVYWERPLAPIPTELSKIWFTYMPLPPLNQLEYQRDIQSNNDGDGLVSPSRRRFLEVQEVQLGLTDRTDRETLIYVYQGERKPFDHGDLRSYVPIELLNGAMMPTFIEVWMRLNQSSVLEMEVSVNGGAPVRTQFHLA